MAEDKSSTKTVRYSDSALALIEQMQKTDFRTYSDLVKLSLIEYAKIHHPELVDALRRELMP